MYLKVDLFNPHDVSHETPGGNEMCAWERVSWLESYWYLFTSPPFWCLGIKFIWNSLEIWINKVKMAQCRNSPARKGKWRGWSGIKGLMVLWWSPSPQLNPCVLFGVYLHVLLSPAWVSSGYSVFLPKFKVMWIRSSIFSKMCSADRVVFFHLIIQYYLTLFTDYITNFVK